MPKGFYPLELLILDKTSMGNRFTQFKNLVTPLAFILPLIALMQIHTKCNQISVIDFPLCISILTVRGDM